MALEGATWIYIHPQPGEINLRNILNKSALYTTPCRSPWHEAFHLNTNPPIIKSCLPGSSVRASSPPQRRWSDAGGGDFGGSAHSPSSRCTQIGDGNQMTTANDDWLWSLGLLAQSPSPVAASSDGIASTGSTSNPWDFAQCAMNYVLATTTSPTNSYCLPIWCRKTCPAR